MKPLIALIIFISVTTNYLDELYNDMRYNTIQMLFIRANSFKDKRLARTILLFRDITFYRELE